MDIRLLGTFEVWEGPVEVGLGGGTARRLFLALALEMGRVVPTERLVELLWDAPPETATEMVHVYVSRVRKALGVHAPALATASGGYVLRLADDTLDSVRFERLVKEAQRQTPLDPQAAVTLLREALELWRGRPLEDFPTYAVAVAEARRLEDRRLDALEALFDLELQLEMHADVVAEARPLTVDHPYRERLRGQLALALYRGGRKAEALDTLGELRAALAESRGVDPSPPLRLLERSILRDDPSLVEARATEHRQISGPGASLVITTPHARRLIALTGDRFTAGRGMDNDLVLEGDPLVSRRHLLLERQGLQWYASDRGSTNGTAVNGLPLEAGGRLLRHHDVMTVGAATLELHLTAEDSTTVREA